MDGYQPKMRCNSCTKQSDCKKYKDGKEACEKYEGKQPNPPKTCSNSQTPSYTPPPMPEVKPPKQRTVLSVRDFAILYMIINNKIERMENLAIFNYHQTEEEQAKEMEKHMERLRQDSYYQDLLRIREKLGELNIEIETPRVEVE